MDLQNIHFRGYSPWNPSPWSHWTQTISSWWDHWLHPSRYRCRRSSVQTQQLQSGPLHPPTCTMRDPARSQLGSSVGWVLEGNLRVSWFSRWSAYPNWIQFFEGGGSGHWASLEAFIVWWHRLSCCIHHTCNLRWLLRRWTYQSTHGGSFGSWWVVRCWRSFLPCCGRICIPRMLVKWQFYHQRCSQGCSWRGWVWATTPTYQISYSKTLGSLVGWRRQRVNLWSPWMRNKNQWGCSQVYHCAPGRRTSFGIDGRRCRPPVHHLWDEVACWVVHHHLPSRWRSGKSASQRITTTWRSCSRYTRDSSDPSSRYTFGRCRVHGSTMWWLGLVERGVWGTPKSNAECWRGYPHTTPWGVWMQPTSTPWTCTSPSCWVGRRTNIHWRWPKWDLLEMPPPPSHQVASPQSSVGAWGDPQWACRVPLATKFHWIHATSMSWREWWLGPRSSQNQPTMSSPPTPKGVRSIVHSMKHFGDANTLRVTKPTTRIIFTLGFVGWGVLDSGRLPRRPIWRRTI